MKEAFFVTCMVNPARFELATFGSASQRSIQLSYGSIRADKSTLCNYKVPSPLSKRTDASVAQQGSTLQY